MYNRTNFTDTVYKRKIMISTETRLLLGIVIISAPFLLAGEGIARLRMVR